MTARRFVPLLFFVLAGCKAGPPSARPVSPQPLESAVPSAPAVSYAPQTPPTRKEVIRILLQSQEIPLTVDASCSGIGTEKKDKNLGDYISGFLAEQDSAKGGNWLNISSKSITGSNKEPLWHNGLAIQHSNGEDVWAWGVSFDIRAKDHSVVPGSFRCTGAG